MLIQEYSVGCNSVVRVWRDDSSSAYGTFISPSVHVCMYCYGANFSVRG